MRAIAARATSFTPIVLLPSGEYVAAGSWPVAAEAEQWARSLQAAGVARPAGVLPLVLPDELVSVLSKEVRR